MLKSLRLVRLKEVLQVIPVSKSSWYRGISEGRFPAGIKISANTTAWKESDIIKLLSNM